MCKVLGIAEKGQHVNKEVILQMLDDETLNFLP